MIVTTIMMICTSADTLLTHTRAARCTLDSPIQCVFPLLFLLREPAADVRRTHACVRAQFVGCVCVEWGPGTAAMTMRRDAILVCARGRQQLHQRSSTQTGTQQAHERTRGDGATTTRLKSLEHTELKPKARATDPDRAHTRCARSRACSRI